MTGITVEATPTASRSFHAISSCSGSAMSAIEQPAARSGRITCWCGAARMSALSAMKWTPQKMMNSASWWWLMRFDSFHESPM